MAGIPKFNDTHLEEICAVIADTNTGLTGSDIGRLLGQLKIADPDPQNTKRIRLYNALSQRQDRDACGNHVVAFIQAAMNPVRYRGSSAFFEDKRAEVNEVLAFEGYALGEDGKLRKRQQGAATTLSQAQQRASRLRVLLVERGIHADVLRFCQAELLQDNFFHAVFEATKSVADKIRQRTGLTADGSQLVDDAFGLGNTGMPLFAFNSLQTPTQQSEHRGLMNLLKGMFGAFRNPPAHSPKIAWPIGEQDALDMMSLASLLHRRLDAAARTPRKC